MKSTSGWANPYRRKDGDNSSGFNGLPGGFCNYDLSSDNRSGSFSNRTEDGLFWSSSDNDSISATIRSLRFFGAGCYGGSLNMKDGLSVRCLRD